jgi:hypothetical protein
MATEKSRQARISEATDKLAQSFVEDTLIKRIGEPIADPA